MRFDDVLADLERRLDVPYPERTALLAEIAGDLDAAWAAGRRRGLSDDAARRAAIAALGLDAAVAGALADLHRTPAARLLSALSPPLRGLAGWSAAALPVLATLAFLILEVPMLDFVHAGGWASTLVLAIGALGVIATLRRAFLWGVARTHSADVLGLEDGTPLLLALATVLLGVGGSGIGVHKVLSPEVLTPEIMRAGLVEALSPLVLGALAAALIIVLDVSARAWLRRTGAPRVVPRV